MKKIVLLLLVIFGSSGIGKCQSGQFEIGDSTFLLNGKPFQIRAGEMHFDRIPREYWEHRLQMVKAMGLNTITTYLFWNKIEPNPDQFDEQTIDDMVEYCRLAQKHGLWVILRPGPYTCAEWEMGGFPWWLLKKSDIALRSQDSYYLERCRNYMLKVGERLAPMQITKGGPILMVQVENEYGHYGSDTVYLSKIRDQIVEAGFEVPLFHCDFFQRFNDMLSGLFTVVNFGSRVSEVQAFEALKKVQPQGPRMAGEYYSGWFDHWGEKHQETSYKDVLRGLNYMLSNGYSFSMYMAHGGTSFGFWAGANYHNTKKRYQPTVSSYDYNAPISEAGWDTPKFYQIRDAISKYLPQNESLPDPPARIPTMEVAEFKLEEVAPVFNNLPEFVEDIQPQNMEIYNQGFGYIIYRTTLASGKADTLKFGGIGDYAQVYINGAKIATINRMFKEDRCAIPERKKPVQLDILVEAMGRINSSVHIHDRKGIVGGVKLTSTGENVKNWHIFPCNLYNNQAPQVKFVKGSTKMPAYYRGSFNLMEAKDTFLNMSTWGKGLVWVNGRCLGRFWNVGPTMTMYLPAPWLKEGKNEVVVLDFLGPQEQSLFGQETPILDSLGSEDAEFVIL